MPPRSVPTHPPPPPSLSVRLVDLVDATIASVRNLAVVSLLAAGWLWWLVFGALTLRGGWRIGLGAVGLLAVLAPSVILWLAFWGLREIRSLPNRTRESIIEGRVTADAAWRTARAQADTRTRGAWNVVRALREIWTLVTDSREMLLGYVALARLANPISLVVLLGAVVGGIAEIGVAALSLVVVLLR